jgi:FkbM family methyltransferase
MNPFCNLILKENNLQNPLVVADVGAAEGIDQPWLQYADIANILCFGFEAFPPNFDVLKSHNKVKYFPYAISNNVGKAEFWGNATNGFLYVGEDKENEVNENISYEKLIVDTETLDNLCNKEVLPSIDVLKIDAEFHEVAVLEGAERQLEKNTLFVKAEFSFSRDLGNSIYRIVDILRAKGFILFDLSCGYYTFNALGGGDALFLKNIFYVLSLLEEKEHIKIMVLKLISICLIVNNINYAFFCLKESSKKGLFTSSEYNSLYDTITEICFAPVALMKSGKTKIKLKLCKLLFLLCHMFGGEMRNESTPKGNRLFKSDRLFFKSKFLQKKNSQYLEKLYEVAMEHNQRYNIFEESLKSVDQG